MQIDIATLAAAVIVGLLAPIAKTSIESIIHNQKKTGPQKKLLKKMLENPKFDFRTIRRLSVVSGTTEEQCRSLLIEIGARGAFLEGDVEGWALVSEMPLETDLDSLKNKSVN